MSRWQRNVLTALALCVAGCSKGDSGPTSHLDGPIGVLSSPNGAEGAAIIEFAGVVDSVMIVGGKAYLRTSGGRTRAALVLDQAGTIRFSLPKITGGSPPAATVIEVADGNNQLRSNTAAYQVTYAR